MVDTGVTKKASAALCGRVKIMQWVDQENYFGADRRRKSGGLRVRERRRYDYVGAPPSLTIALRQLRMRVIDAHGQGAAIFAERARAVAELARIQKEFDAADALTALALTATRGVYRDERPALYDGLARVHARLRTAH